MVLVTLGRRNTGRQDRLRHRMMVNGAYDNDRTELDDRDYGLPRDAVTHDNFILKFVRARAFETVACHCLLGILCCCRTCSSSTKADFHSGVSCRRQFH